MKLPMTVNVTRAIHYLSRQLYPEPIYSLRELVVNGLDEGSKRIEIRISPKVIEIEDWGRGIQKVDELTKVFTDYKETQNTQLNSVVGQFGIGRLSAFMFADSVIYRTNNGEVGYIIPFDINQTEVDIGDAVKAERALPHVGTLVTILNPQNIPDMQSIEYFLARTFGLKIVRGAQIILNGKTLRPSRDLSNINVTPNVNIPFRSGNIIGAITESKDCSVHVFVKGLLIAKKAIEPTRGYRGWVNCDTLSPTIYRTDFYEDNIWKDFVETLANYIKNHYPKRDAIVGKRMRDAFRYLAKIADPVLREAGIGIEGRVPTSDKTEEKGQTMVVRAEPDKNKTGVKDTEDPKTPQPTRVKLHSPLLDPEGIARPLKTDYGVILYFRALGADKGPIEGIRPNSLIINVSHPLVSLIDEHAPRPKYLLYAPLYSRGVIALSGETFATHADYESRVDGITCKLLFKALGAPKPRLAEQPLTITEIE